ncbi:heat-inducible transcription repressor HrcA [bacterium]|nr:heat-inducible transcription repressor HrcA [candidate division CSSED10-310 bacterium]
MTEPQSHDDFPELDERQRQVFRKIMEVFIREAGPVGSRRIAKEFGLSAATIRNIMADLEDIGLLDQPHVSAGRTPTDAGYRYYVDYCIDGISKPSSLDSEARRRISESLADRSEIERIMLQASQMLSSLTNYAGLVVAPKVRNLIFQRIQFIRVNERRILVVLLAKNGLVQNKLIVTDHDYDQDMLDRITRLLNERFGDKTLREMRQEIVSMLEEDRRKYDHLLDSAARLGELAVNREFFEKDKVYLEGTFNILDLPEFKDLSRLRDLFKTFTERAAMVRLLDRCLDEDGVSVAIGSETEIPEISDMSVVTARYSMNDNVTGGLGVIGPKRMPYRQIIALVSYMASFLSYMLKNWDHPDIEFENLGTNGDEEA